MYRDPDCSEKLSGSESPAQLTELAIENLPGFPAEILEQTRSGECPFDLGAVTIRDAAAIQRLSSADRTFRSFGQCLRLTGVNSDLGKCLREAGANELLSSFGDRCKFDVTASQALRLE